MVPSLQQLVIKDDIQLYLSAISDTSKNQLLQAAISVFYNGTQSSESEVPGSSTTKALLIFVYSIDFVFHTPRQCHHKCHI